MIVRGSIQHLRVKLSRGVMVVLGDAVEGPDGHLKLIGSKMEPHHPIGQQGQPQAELHQPLAPQGGDHHPLAGHQEKYNR